ncbi:hypothetical protein BBK82_07430 [Lentzea guizhouensis]|uniref:NB-ARC domain-containing protein n=1 Tax=Lentzea guizhouensis TaxID=1586287 RepID=A0A1B2HDY7_9PSEU|nr:hypothetical protein BBK82_07430 [Lentzea guizhouensis]
MYGECVDQGRSCLFYVHGLDGMGRMSLAGEFFHQHHSDFDAYVEVAARQPNGRLTPAGEMLGQALRGLGVPDTELPVGLDDRAFAFQARSAGRRFMMVVRDVADVEQVTLLVPHSAPGAVVAVTGRAMLRGLLMHDFVDVPLGRLPREDAKTLLTASIGADDVPTPVVDELAAICDDVPLLIRILGAQLRHRAPSAIERHLRQLRASDAALLELEHAQRVGKFLEVTESLVREQQTALRRLALIPGPDFEVNAAAVALDLSADDAEQMLEALADKHLVIWDNSRDRYSLYRMVRTHARRMADKDDGPEMIKEIVGKITAWTLREAIPRDVGLADRWRVGREFELFAAANLRPVPRAAATAWFDVEWKSLVACVQAAHEQGLHDIASQLCVAAFKYLHLHGHFDDWIDCHNLGVRSTEISGDMAGRMQLTSQRGAAHLALGNTKVAKQDFEASWQAATEIDHRLGLQSAWEWRGKTAAAEGDLDYAFHCFDESDAVIERSEQEIPPKQRTRMRALLILHRARAWVKLKDWNRAVNAVSSIMEYFAASGETDNHAKCLLVLGDGALGSDDPAKAAGYYGQAAALFARDQAPRAQADALHKSGLAQRAAGDSGGASEAFRLAKELFVRLGDRRADVVDGLLRGQVNDR